MIGMLSMSRPNNHLLCVVTFVFTPETPLMPDTFTGLGCLLEF